MLLRFVSAVVAAGIILAGQALVSTGAAAQSLEVFFKSQPFTIVCGYPPGASYDAYARIIARHIGKHLPGQPTVIVRNMPGAGSVTAANHLYTGAPKDGSVIGTFSRGVPMMPLLDDQGARFDPRQFNWIGSPSTEVSLALSWHTSPAKTFEDLRTKEITVAASGPAADSTVFARVLNAVLGTKLKIISGYTGAADILLAIERGEVDGSTGISWSSLARGKKDWIEQKKINFLVQLGLSGRDDLQGVPVVVDLAKTEEDRQVLELIFSRQTVAYPFTAPPGVPADRLQATRDAFAATMKDPEFLAEAERTDMTIDPVSASEIATMLERAYASAPQVLERARAAVSPGGP